MGPQSRLPPVTPAPELAGNRLRERPPAPPREVPQRGRGEEALWPPSPSAGPWTVSQGLGDKMPIQVGIRPPCAAPSMMMTPAARNCATAPPNPNNNVTKTLLRLFPFYRRGH